MRYRQRVASTRKLVAALTRPGPHRVLRGDLAFAGLPGTVYTPESGLNLPGVAFGHDWLVGVERYWRLLEHLASWGIVAAAPNTERGPAPSVLDFSFDLRTALDIATGVRLGPGKISVHPTKLGVVGHGFGGSAAVLAAAAMTPAPAGVAAIFPSVTKPSPEQAAASLDLPGLVLAAPGDTQTLRSNAVSLSRAWDGAVLRTVSKAKASGLPAGRPLMKALGVSGCDRRTQKSVRALLTGYLLSVLAGDKTYRVFADPQVRLPRTAAEAAIAEPSTEDKIATLLKI